MYNKYNALHSRLIERCYKDALSELTNDSKGHMAKQMLNNDLPLHIALNINAPDDLVVALYKAYPQGAKMRASDGKTAIQIAAKMERSAFVQDRLRGLHVQKGKTKETSLEERMRTSLDRSLIKALSHRALLRKEHAPISSSIN